VAADGKAPLHQLLGSDSYGLAKARIDALTADVENGREAAFSTDITRGRCPDHQRKGNPPHRGWRPSSP
jgi:hypothetical protein